MAGVSAPEEGGGFKEAEKALVEKAAREKAASDKAGRGKKDPSTWELNCEGTFDAWAIRASPSRDGRRLRAVPHGAILRVIEENPEGWLRLESGEGWVMQTMQGVGWSRLEVSTWQLDCADTFQDWNVRAAPNTGAEVLRLVDDGTVVRVIGSVAQRLSAARIWH